MKPERFDLGYCGSKVERTSELAVRAGGVGWAVSRTGAFEVPRPFCFSKWLTGAGGG